MDLNGFLEEKYAATVEVAHSSSYNVTGITIFDAKNSSCGR
jgi:hypothetical protein